MKHSIAVFGAPLATVSALALVRAAATSIDCTKPPNADFYAVVQKEINQCQARVEFVPELPLTNEQRGMLCSKCGKLAVATVKKQFGNCTVLDRASGLRTTLQAKIEKIFVCNEAELPSGSDAGVDGIVINTTPTPTKPATQPPSDSASGGSTSTVNVSRDSFLSTGTIIGIVLACVVVVVLVVAVIVRRRRQIDGEDDPHKPQHSLVLTATLMKQSSVSTPILEAAAHSSGIIIHNDNSYSRNEQQRATPAATESDSSVWDDEVIVAARVPREKVLSDKLLSRGGFGEVYRGSYNGQVVAIKTLLPETKKSMKQINAFLAEVKLMATLEHAQIVRFVGVAWDSLTDLCVLSEFMEGGDLRGLLTQYEDEHRPHGFDADKIRIALHIAHALTYLHSLRPVVLHRDLKSKNILLDRELNAKLTDFGVSRERSDTTTMTAGVGTSLWMAPEVMLGERYDEKSDMFSFGIVLSELDSHLLPYANAKAQASSDSGHRLPDTAILQMVSLGRLSVEFSPHANPAVVAIARACVSVDPSKRPTAADALYTLHSLRKHY